MSRVSGSTIGVRVQRDPILDNYLIKEQWTCRPVQLHEELGVHWHEDEGSNHGIIPDTGLLEKKSSPNSLVH